MSKNKSLVPKKELGWADMTILLDKPKTPTELKSQQMILFISEAFGLPPQGINILGGKPYINKDGLTFKLWEYFGDQIVSVKQRLLKVAEKPEDQAVGKVIITIEDSHVSEKKQFEAFGTASARNIQMSTIRGFANELALTRAFNRCVRQMVIKPMYDTFIQKMRQLSKDKQRMALIGFESVSAEEMPDREEKTVEVIDIKEQDLDGVRPALVMLNNVEKLPFAKRKMELKRIKIELSKMKKSWNENQLAYVADKFNKIESKYVL